MNETFPFDGFPILSFMIFWIFGFLFYISSKVFLALCIYTDSKYRRDKNAALWAILSGFSFITAIVYLVIRFSSKNKPHRCTFCGTFMAPDGIYCPYCGRMTYMESPEDMAKYDRRRKLFLSLWIVSLFAFIILYVSAMVFFCTTLR